MNILNPVCSELVLPLYMKNIDEIRHAIKKAEELTGWKLACIVMDLKTHNTLIAYISPEEFMAKDKEFVPDPEAISSEKLKKIIMAREDSDYHIRIGLVQKDIPTNVWIDEDIIMKYGEPIDISFRTGFYHRTIFRAFSDGYSPHFEPLFKLAKGFRKIWHAEDGGRTDIIEKWIAKHHRSEAAELAKEILADPHSDLVVKEYAERLLSIVEGEDDKI